MTPAGPLLAAAAAGGGTAALAGALLPASARRVVVASTTAVVSAVGLVAAGLVLVAGPTGQLRLPGVLPLAGVAFGLDRLGALFVLACGVVGVPASVYGIGYRGHGMDDRLVCVAYPLFVVSLILVPCATTVSALLMVWELMAGSSLVLLLAEHRHRAEVRDAVKWYAAMTHLGLVCLLMSLFVFAAHARSDSFAALRAAAGSMSPLMRGLVFGLGLVGFGSKAGVVPLHVWLPRAHPEAPSHVSALMSGVMVKMGIYGIVRVAWDLLGGGPRWWGLTVLLVGVASALFGVLHALVSADLKRLLAYSTTENVGLILIGVGAAGIYAASGNRALAAIAITAALLHVVNHAAFKGLLFLGAGSVLRATGLRDLDRLGGLVGRMPVTSATFAVGMLAIAGLPPLNGFVSEWLLVQSLVHGLPSPSTMVVVVMPLAVAAVALTGGLAAAAFVKAFGTGFLALPRSSQAASAVEQPRSMRVAMIMLAATCLGLGVVPSVVTAHLTRAGGPLNPAVVRGGLGWVHLAGLSASLSPLLIGIILLAGLAGFAGIMRSGARRRRRPAENWGCGRSVQTARMEYTATSYAEPLQRVFDDVLRPDLDVDVSHRAESEYYVEAVRYRLAFHDPFDARIYEPLTVLLRRWGRWARRIHNGSVHRYLAYALVSLVVVLLVTR